MQEKIQKGRSANLASQAGASGKGINREHKTRKLIFKFNETNLKGDVQGMGKLKRLFKRSGQYLVGAEVENKVRRSSGTTYRKIFLSFVDSQTIELWVTRTGDIFKIKVNNGIKPLKHQYNHVAAIAEMAGYLDSGRVAFQRKLARQKITISTTKKMPRLSNIKKLETEYDEIQAEIKATKAEIEVLA